MDASVDDASYQTTSVYGFGHPLYYDNVIGTLRGEAHARDRRPRGPALAGGADRRCTVSARDGVRVGLPLVY